MCAAFLSEGGQISYRWSLFGVHVESLLRMRGQSLPVSPEAGSTVACFPPHNEPYKVERPIIMGLSSSARLWRM